MRRLGLVLALAALPAAGCIFFVGGDGDDCAELAAPTQGLRNPQTGVCENVGGGNGCGPQPLADEAAPIFQPDWAACESQCTGLSETACKAADGCRAIYTDWCSPAGLDCISQDYADCWATAPSGPVRGPCDGLDAQECSRHDDCAAVHLETCRPGTQGCSPGPDEFSSCIDEQATLPP